MGGIYADMDTVAIKSPKEWISGKEHSQLIMTLENETHFCQWVFAAPKGSKVLNDVIELAVRKLLSAVKFDSAHLCMNSLDQERSLHVFLTTLKKNKLPMYTENKYDYINYVMKDHLYMYIIILNFMVRIIWYNTYSQVKILTDGVTKEIFILDQLNKRYKLYKLYKLYENSSIFPCFPASRI